MSRNYEKEKTLTTLYSKYHYFLCVSLGVTIGIRPYKSSEKGIVRNVDVILTESKLSVPFTNDHRTLGRVDNVIHKSWVKGAYFQTPIKHDFKRNGVSISFDNLMKQALHEIFFVSKSEYLYVGEFNPLDPDLYKAIEHRRRPNPTNQIYTRKSKEIRQKLKMVFFD